MIEEEEEKKEVNEGRATERRNQIQPGVCTLCNDVLFIDDNAFN